MKSVFLAHRNDLWIKTVSENRQRVKQATVYLCLMGYVEWRGIISSQKQQIFAKDFHAQSPGKAPAGARRVDIRNRGGSGGQVPLALRL
jgi:hypothetical protein